MDLKETYKQLTSIDIDEQKRIWDERGKGYYGEYILFCKLYKDVVGTSKILMNLNIPVDDINSTEIDLLLIHETGLYVFEVKHYKGTIYGKDTDSTWTQYFRTTKNSTFKNPIEQNGYHIRALKRIFPHTPIRSVIVFTSSECDIRVENSNDELDISSINNLGRILDNRFESEKKFTAKDIDQIFCQLSVYSQMQKPVLIDKDEASFFSWIEPTISKLEEKKAEVEQIKGDWMRNVKKQKKSIRIGIIANILVAIACIFFSVIIIQGFQKKYDYELGSFKQNFLHIDEINNPYIDVLNSYVTISDVSLLPLTDDAVSFTAKIAMKNDTYGVALTENSKYIVMTTSGMVYEYNVFGEHLKYNKLANRIGTGIRSYGELAKAQFYGISDTNDISYIKITDIDLFKLDLNKTLIKDKLEIELYTIN